MREWEGGDDGLSAWQVRWINGEDARRFSLYDFSLGAFSALLVVSVAQWLSGDATWSSAAIGSAAAIVGMWSYGR